MVGALIMMKVVNAEITGVVAVDEGVVAAVDLAVALVGINFIYFKGIYCFLCFFIIKIHLFIYFYQKLVAVS